jgi:hypothetical protein
LKVGRDRTSLLWAIPLAHQVALTGRLAIDKPELARRPFLEEGFNVVREHRTEQGADALVQFAGNEVQPFLKVTTLGAVAGGVGAEADRLPEAKYVSRLRVGNKTSAELPSPLLWQTVSATIKCICMN